MADFTKEEVLALGPCKPWDPVLVSAYPNASASGSEIKAYVEQQNAGNIGPLVWLMGGSVALATEFIEVVGLSVGLTDDTDHTALHYAVLRSDDALVTYLLGKGADKNTPDDQGKTPLDLAISINNPAVLAAMGV